MSKPKEKFVFLCIKVRDGEREYYCNSVHTISSRRKLDKFADDYAKEFYMSKPEAEDGGYYHFGGEVHVSANNYREITKDEFDILIRFL